MWERFVEIDGIGDWQRLGWVQAGNLEVEDLSILFRTGGTSGDIFRLLFSYPLECSLYAIHFNRH